MATKPYESIVTSILLSPINYGRKITGFKKEYPPLPWYTRSEMEEVMREEQTITAPVPEEEDAVLKTLREKDLRMKRNLSKYLTDDSQEESTAKRECKEPAVESRSSLSSEEMMTPNSPPSPVVVPSPPVEQVMNQSGCFRLEIEPIDASSYQLDPISQNVSPLVTTEHNTPTSLTGKRSTADSQNKVVKDDVTTNQLKSKILVAPPSPNLPTKDTPELTEEEAADISRKGFILRYETMCRVLGVSGQDSDRILKEWQEEETGTKTKPPGILKNPKERFDTKSDGALSTPVTTPTSEKTVSFCIPQVSLSSISVSISPTATHSNLPTLFPITTASSPGEEEPITPTLTAAPSIPILPSALMSTPLPAALPNRGLIPPLTSQDISIITHVPIPTQSIPFVPSSNTLTAAPTTSVLTAPSLSSSNNVFNPLGFLSQVQSSKAPPVPTSHLNPLFPVPPSSQSSNNLFKLPSNQPAPVSTPSLFQTPLTTKSPFIQSATSLQLKSNKPFHNLELSFSIPTAAKPLINPLAPTHTSTLPSLPPISSATSFNPSIANNSPFMPLAKSTQSQFLPQGPLLSSTPAQAFPVSTPSFQLNSQPPALPQAALPTFTPGIPLNFSFGQSTDTSATNIFLGPAAATGGGLRSGGYSSSRGASRGQHKKKRK
eukprot:TRINITY_DN169_c0_g1_i3.p1 TRINITY_DN169_c0_g1~~TRINITY_DN169_c0_g1_i3.p1  ORF type:complete len:660 (-),score=197.44 TRINITY_DN169_c0_g1_i3:420-2399(-)